MSDYLIYLSLTVAIELAIVMALAWRLRWQSRFRLLTAVFAINLISHPFAWNAFHFFGSGSYWPIEILVFGFEGAAIAWLVPIPLGRAMLISAVTNGATMIAGWLLVVVS